MTNKIPPAFMSTLSPGEEGDREDEIEMSAQMTASYSEISFRSELEGAEAEANSLMDNTADAGEWSSCSGASPFKAPPLDSSAAAVASATANHRRPHTLNYLSSSGLTEPGTIHKEGNMTHFVAEDFEQKIKLSSPQATKTTTGHFVAGRHMVGGVAIAQVDARLLSDLECEAHCLATSIDSLTENLCGILHSVSSITADNVDVYKNAVSKMSNSMDANIKSMYTMMAKAEEVSQAIKSVQVHHTRIKEIRRIVDLFESYM